MISDAYYQQIVVSQYILVIFSILILANPIYFILNIMAQILLTTPSPQLMNENRLAYQKCLQSYGPSGCYPLVCLDMYDC